MSDHGCTCSTPAPSACGGRASPARAMGNSLGARPPASGSSSKRDRDAIEVRILLELNPALAHYSTFDGLNTPSFHFAAAKDHLDIVTMLLDKAASVGYNPQDASHANSREHLIHGDCHRICCLINLILES